MIRPRKALQTPGLPTVSGGYDSPAFTGKSLGFRHPMGTRGAYCPFARDLGDVCGRAPIALATQSKGLCSSILHSAWGERRSGREIVAAAERATMRLGARPEMSQRQPLSIVLARNASMMHDRLVSAP